MYALTPIQLSQFLRWSSGELRRPLSNLISFYAANQDSFDADYRLYLEEYRQTERIIGAETRVA